MDNKRTIESLLAPPLCLDVEIRADLRQPLLRFLASGAILALPRPLVAEPTYWTATAHATARFSVPSTTFLICAPRLECAVGALVDARQAALVCTCRHGEARQPTCSF